MFSPFGDGAFPYKDLAHFQQFSKTLVTKDVCLRAQFSGSIAA